MLARNGTRQPQAANCSSVVSPAIRPRAPLASSSPAGPPHCGQLMAKPRRLGSVHSPASRMDPPPLAAEPDPLQRAAGQQQHAAPDADGVVARHQADADRGRPHEQHRGHERRLAPQPVTHVPEDDSAQRPRREPDEVGREGQQGAGEGIRLGKEEPREHQGRDDAVEKEVVPLDGGADGRCRERPEPHPAPSGGIQIGWRQRRRCAWLGRVVGGLAGHRCRRCACRSGAQPTKQAPRLGLGHASILPGARCLDRRVAARLGKRSAAARRRRTPHVDHELETHATMSTRRLDVDSVAEGLLELLESRGVRCFFGGGAGTDFPPIIEAFAKRQALGRSGRPATDHRGPRDHRGGDGPRLRHGHR